MPQINKVGTVSTTVRSKDGITRVTYHNTDVVVFTDDEIILNTGGWFTATTKVRMNQASSQFNLGFYVFQKDNRWFVTFKGQTFPFIRGSLTLDRMV